jgi:hypothetical protein
VSLPHLDLRDRREFARLLVGVESQIAAPRVADTLALAADLNVATTFCARLSRDARRGVAPDLLDRIDDVAQSSAARNTLLMAEGACISAMFDAGGIDHVFIKGAALLAGVYESLAARAMNDLDVWVRPEQLARAREILLAAGFDDSAADHPTPDGGTLRDFRSEDDHEALPLVSADGTVVDLHRHFPDVAPSGPFDFEQVLSRSVRVAVPGGAIRVAGRGDTLAHVCAHVFVHHLGGRTLVTRHLADVAALIGHASVTPRQMAEYARGPAGAAVSLSIRLVRAIVAAVPTPFDDALIAFAVPTPTASRRMEHLQDSALLVRRLVRDLRDNPQRFVQRVFPDRRWMARAYGVEADSLVLPALYAWRVVSWPFPALRRDPK